MASLLSQVTNNPLLSGIKVTALVQVQTCIDSAILIAETVYQSLGLHKPTEQGTSAINALPHDACSEVHILDIGPKGAAYCGAISRTTAAIKSISGPISHEDGVALLSSYKEVQTKTIVILAAATVRISSIEQGASGLCDYGFNKLLSLYELTTPEIGLDLLLVLSSYWELRTIFIRNGVNGKIWERPIVIGT
ncbi:hypothetical protein Clacol_005874 [Clathrus columnatus]|uniref:Uncharacterized protein n=1 Tax=Clathrus columnatus TaxID=1419009 RepID=A0AAV5AG44_9AGAM|nr:hypothetical protein Clacol_005874 [Clathrus columnatus]